MKTLKLVLIAERLYKEILANAVATLEKSKVKSSQRYERAVKRADRMEEVAFKLYDGALDKEAKARFKSMATKNELNAAQEQVLAHVKQLEKPDVNAAN